MSVSLIAIGFWTIQKVLYYILCLCMLVLSLFIITSINF